jgi:hypothetical protein
MKTIIFSLLLLSTLGLRICNAQHFCNWAVYVHDTSSNNIYGSREAKDLAISRSGNVYITGTIGPSANFYTGQNNNIFRYPFYIAKYDSLGNLMWLSYIDGLIYGSTYLAVDSNENIFLISRSTSTCTFWREKKHISLPAPLKENTFLVKYNSSGFPVMAKWMGTEVVTSVAVDKDGSLYTSGLYRDSCYFNSGVELSLRIPIGNSDSFLAKYDTSVSLIWVRSINGSDKNCESEVYSMSLDRFGHLYIAGNIKSGKYTIDGHSEEFISTGSGPIFISRFDTSGNYQWFKFAADKQNVCARYPSIVASSSGDIIFNVYLFTLTGSDSVDIDPGLGSNMIPVSSTFIYLVRIDSNGNAIRAKLVGNTKRDFLMLESIDDSDNVFFANGRDNNLREVPTGSFGYFTKDWVEESWWPTAAGFTVVVRQFNNSTYYLYGEMEAGGQNEIYIGEGPNGEVIIHPVDKSNFILARYSFNKPANVRRNLQEVQSLIFPNPARDKIEAILSTPIDEPVIVEVVDLLGRTVAKKAYDVDQNTNSISIDIKPFPKGYYTLLMQSHTGMTRSTFIKR